MVDFGSDVSDYTDVDPLFGTLEDFDELIKALHHKGMKLVMDFIPNHTSNKHRWFEASRKREQPYDEFYVWADGSEEEGGTRVPPNQWVLLLPNLSVSVSLSRSVNLHLISCSPDKGDRVIYVTKLVIGCISNS